MQDWADCSITIPSLFVDLSSSQTQIEFENKVVQQGKTVSIIPIILIVVE